MYQSSSAKAPWEFCSDCTYWIEREKEDWMNGEEWGECHLNPPSVIIPDAPYRVHLLTHQEDFCSHAVLRNNRSQPNW